MTAILQGNIRYLSKYRWARISSILKSMLLAYTKSFGYCGRSITFGYVASGTNTGAVKYSGYLLPSKKYV